MPTRIEKNQLIKAPNGEFFISAYQDAAPTPEDLANAVKRLSVAFPQQSTEFFALAVHEMLDMGFTKNRLNDGVTYIIRTFPYKQPNIADLVSFDKKKRLYTHGQMLSKLVCNGGTEKSTDSFRKVEIDGQIFWYLPSENL